MFSFNSNATIQENFNYSNNYINSTYSNVRMMDMDEFNKFNIYNATFLDDGKYYLPIQINNISEKEIIMNLYENEKYFEEEENSILEKIIENNSVPTQNNFFDYYD